MESDKMFKARPGGLDTDLDSDEDSITTASTEVSQDVENQIFPVKEILADKWSEDYQTRVYLVYWEGYPIERATWEPASSFDEGREYIITDYLKSKGQREEFNWQKWEGEREKDARLKQERQKRRAAKRRRRGQVHVQQFKPPKRRVAKSAMESTRETNWAASDEDLEGNLAGFIVLDDDQDSDVPIVRRKTRKRRRIGEHSETEYSEVSGSEGDSEAGSPMEEVVGSAQPSSPGSGLRRASNRGDGDLVVANAATDNVPPKAKMKRPMPQSDESSLSRRRKIAHAPSTREAAKTPVIYNKLSIRNLVQKKSKRDLAPPAETLQLFKPGEGGGLSRQGNAATAPLPESPVVQQAPTSTLTIRTQRRTPTPPPAASMPSISASPSHGGITKQPGRIKLANETDSYTTFNCVVEYGSSPRDMRSLGTIKFLGFGNEFLAMLQDLNIEKLWISKTLEAKYLVERFIPVYGPPLEYVDLDCDSEPSELPGLLSVLSTLQGAGIVVHKEFTLIVFQPSFEKLRNSFKAPQQRSKTALRAALYPSIGVGIPDSQPDTPMPQKALDDGFDRYLSNLMFRHTGCYKDILKKRHSDSTTVEFSATICPEIARRERLELENILRLQGHRIFKCAGYLELEKKLRNKKSHVTVFIHQSLRFQLHLLPYIEGLRNINGVSFRLFGLRLDRVPGPSGEQLITIDERIWPFGSVILMTNKFLASDTSVVREVLSYQKTKAASTKLCVCSDFIGRLEAFAITFVRLGGDPTLANDILAISYGLESRIAPESSGGVITLKAPERASSTKAVSQSAEVAPQPAEVVPQSAEVVPQSAEVVPQSAEVVPQSAEVVPQSSEVVPQLAEVVPQAMMDLEPGEIPLGLDETEPMAVAAKQELETEMELEHLIDMFALYHLEQATEYRRFIVCYSHSQSTQVLDMQKVFPTITFLSPEKALTELHLPSAKNTPTVRSVSKK